MKGLLYIFLLQLLLLCSCRESVSDRINLLHHEWQGKTIYFPVDSLFTVVDKDSVSSYYMEQHVQDYAVLVYIDSAKCTATDWRLKEWKQFIETMNVVAQHPVPCLFFFHPETLEDRICLEEALCIADFRYPVCIDPENRIDKLNHFPQEEGFQTFLVNREREVIVIGDPLRDVGIKKKYLDVLAHS